MAYSLSTAISEFKRTELWHERAATKEPLEGLPDGENKTFYTPHFPLSSGVGIIIYDIDGTVFSSGSYNVESYETGTIIFNTPPTQRYYASYTTQTLSDTKLTDVMKAGFDKMEVEYNRNWYLVTSDSETYISSNSSSVVDPVTGSYTFSTSRAQVKLYLLCCEYEFEKARAKFAAQNFYRYRESRAGGVQIDKSRNPDQLKALLDLIQREIEDAVAVCANQSGDYPWGTYVPGTKSDVFLDQYDWWKYSKQYYGEEP